LNREKSEDGAIDLSGSLTNSIERYKINIQNDQNNDPSF